MSDAQVRLDVPGGRASVHASGEFDVATAPVLREALQQACGSALDVELDLSGVTFMDACGLREIAGARNTLSQRRMLPERRPRQCAGASGVRTHWHVRANPRLSQ